MQSRVSRSSGLVSSDEGVFRVASPAEPTPCRYISLLHPVKLKISHAVTQYCSILRVTQRGQISCTSFSLRNSDTRKIVQLRIRNSINTMCIGIEKMSASPYTSPFTSLHTVKYTVRWSENMRFDIGLHICNVFDSEFRRGDGAMAGIDRA